MSLIMKKADCFIQTTNTLGLWYTIYLSMVYINTTTTSLWFTYGLHTYLYMPVLTTVRSCIIFAYGIPIYGILL